ncbi:MAG TPA: bifunctional pyr operon transcriptional regulator/uracil phosphoribosyltransferase PyrR [Euzebyales bacterium]
MTSARAPGPGSDGSGHAVREVLDDDAIRRAVRRMSHQILEHHGGADGVVLMGVHTRGVPLARRLARAILDIEQIAVPTGVLDVSLYRDDYAHIGPRPLASTHFPVDTDGHTVVLVDDVLYTGRTIRAAMEAVIDQGRPGAIELAVLVDRGHRELPIRADYVGKNLPTARDEVVRVRLTEHDGVDRVTIEHRAGDR